MTLREAKDMVKAIAGERYHDTTVRLVEGKSVSGGDYIEEYLQCGIYVEGVGHFYGESFTAALDNIQSFMRDKETRIEELQAEDANV